MIPFHQIPYRYRIRQPYAVLRNKKRESIRLHPARLHFKDHRRAVPLSDFQRSILIRAQVDMMPGAFYQAGSQNAVDVLAPCTVVQYRRRILRLISQFDLNGMPLVGPDHFAVIIEGEPFFGIVLNDVFEGLKV